MLEVVGLSKKYGHLPVLRGIDFTVQPGEILGYLGPNGAGKSTTVNILTGLLPATSGRIRYRGHEVLGNIRPFQRILGYVPENAEVYGHMSAWEYLLLVGRLRRVEESILTPRLERLLSLLKLDYFAHAPISTFSKGMRQKVLLIAALIHDPEVIILDEPLSGLDTAVVLVIRHLIRELADRGKTIFFSSHRLDEVERICTRVLILHRGSIVAHDSVANLRELMAAPNLEEIFRQLVMQEDPQATAQAIAATLAGEARV